MKTISIDPITRLEGHGKIEIFLNDDGSVANAYFQVPELRGFEKFCEGRPVEELPSIVTKICGVCPGCHHMASGKAVDAVFGVTPPPLHGKSVNYSIWHIMFTVILPIFLPLLHQTLSSVPPLLRKRGISWVSSKKLACKLAARSLSNEG